MPIYEYVCEKCETEFEVEQRITEDPIKTCPHCRSRKVKRLISQTSFVLKGGGWYSDLYASPTAKAEEKSDAKGKEADKSAPSSEKAEKADKGKGGDAKSTGESGSKGGGKGKGKTPKAAA